MLMAFIGKSQTIYTLGDNKTVIQKNDDSYYLSYTKGKNKKAVEHTYLWGNKDSALIFWTKVQRISVGNTAVSDTGQNNVNMIIDPTNRGVNLRVAWNDTTKKKTKPTIIYVDYIEIEDILNYLKY